jgi:uncharacterized RDD family membrane protein YckC
MRNENGIGRIQKAPAGFWRRLAAGATDFVLCFPLYVLLYWGTIQLLDYLESDLMFDIFWEVIPGFFGFLFLFTMVMEVTPLRATVGKLIFGIRILDRNGDRAGMDRVLLRHLAKLLTLLTAGIGFVMVAFRKDRRSLHDLLTGCSVMRVRRTHLGA